jgi:uncharacterized membrane protein YdjX (TVP38/TMEM64 family)
MKNLPGGWGIPIAVLVILNFPPLFGQEIVCLLCGLVWGLWWGFGIVAAGTLYLSCRACRGALLCAWCTR